MAVVMTLSAAQDLTSPDADAAPSLRVQGQSVWRWREGATDMYWLKGDCRMTLGDQQILSEETLLKVQRQGDSIAVDVLASGAVEIDGRAASGTASCSWIRGPRSMPNSTVVLRRSRLPCWPRWPTGTLPRRASLERSSLRSSRHRCRARLHRALTIHREPFRLPGR